MGQNRYEQIVKGPNLFFSSSMSIFFLSKDITERLAIVGDSTTPVSLKISKHKSTS
jgi:hypothetical protein